jgi:hypothetical protein
MRRRVEGVVRRVERVWRRWWVGVCCCCCCCCCCCWMVVAEEALGGVGGLAGMKSEGMQIMVH